jgi:phage tail-like protein
MRDVNGSSFVLLADQGDWAPPVDVTAGPHLGVISGMTWTASTWTLAGKQSWRLPAATARADAQARANEQAAALSSTSFVVVDAFNGVARINAGGVGVESLNGATWTPVIDQNGTPLAPKVGSTFKAMSLGGSRLALLASDGANVTLDLFDLRGRWPLVSLALDSGGTAVAAAAEGQIFVLGPGGLAIFEGGPIDELFAPPIGVFLPVSANPNPLRRTALLNSSALALGPGSVALGMAVDAERVGILMDDGTGAQTIALLDRASGAWTGAPVPINSTDGTPLPYMTDIALMRDGFVALMAPAGPAPSGPLDCAVGTVSSQGLTLAPRRYPMLDQYAARFASLPGPDVFYLGGTPPPNGVPLPRRLLPLSHPGYLTSGALARFAIPGSDPDQVWHRVYAEAYLPQGTTVTIWARAAEVRFDDAVPQATLVVEQADSALSQAKLAGNATAIGAAQAALASAQTDLQAAKALAKTDQITAATLVAEQASSALSQATLAGNATAIAAAQAALAHAQTDLQAVKSLSVADQNTQAAADQAALAAVLLAATPDLAPLNAANAATVAKNNSLPPLSATLTAALTVAPFHRQPPLTAVSQPSELPFHPGLAALAGAPGALYEVLLQRGVGANRRLTGAFLDIVAIAAGDGRHSPCLRAIRVYSSRFSYQDEYLPTYFHQTQISDESDVAATASPPDFRERLLANFEGLLTPIENRVAAAEYLLDPNAAPASALPWLCSYFGRTLDPTWPQARSRRALAAMGRQFRQRGTYRGVCLALDIATDGAVARGEIVVLETFRLRRSDATVLGIPMSGRNSLTGYGVPSGNSIVGDTLTLSAERSIDMLALLAPSAASTADPSAASQLLVEYADRFQVTVLLQGPTTAALRPIVSNVLLAELPAQLGFDIVATDQRFILGLSPLLDVDTFLDPSAAPAPLTLDQSVVGRDAIVRNPAALRQ